MVEAVTKHGVRRFDQSGQRACIGGVSRGKQNGRLGPLEFCEPTFELAVPFRATANQGAGPCSDPVFIKSFTGRCNHTIVVGQVEVVVRGEIPEKLSVNLAPAVRRRTYRTCLPQQARFSQVVQSLTQLNSHATNVLPPKEPFQTRVR